VKLFRRLAIHETIFLQQEAISRGQRRRPETIVCKDGSVGQATEFDHVSDPHPSLPRLLHGPSGRDAKVSFESLIAIIFQVVAQRVFNN
jgi:hypothetical protein